MKDICRELVYADGQDFGDLRFSPRFGMVLLEVELGV